jgi:D-alanyl-D-alanine carboxypeptidase/D-alanyl-D-alanine-endopeptidase (penicillin-binding protein 4)
MSSPVLKQASKIIHNKGCSPWQFGARSLEGVRRLSISVFVGVIALQVGCSQGTSSTPLADPELVENSQVYIGDDLYHLAAASPEQENSPQSEGVPSSHDFAVGSHTPVHGANQAVKPTPRPTPRPVDVDFVLTKAKDISVGVSADVPQARVQNESKPFIPASITKVLTTSAALKSLGTNFRFKTTISFSQEGSVAKDLMIEADGDPTVEMEAYSAGAPKRMSEMATALKAKGIGEVRGPVTLVSTYPQLDEIRYAPGIPDVDMRECYGSLASSFNYQGNCAVARIHPKTGFRWESAGIGERILGELDTTAGERNSLSIDVLLNPARVLGGFRLRGTYSAQGPRVIHWKLPIGNAAGWYGHEFVKSLRSKQVKLATDTTVVFAGSKEDRLKALNTKLQLGRVQLVFESADLAALTEAINKPSDNFLADAVLKAVGVRMVSNAVSSNLGASDALELGRIKLSETNAQWLAKDGQMNLKDELRFLDGAGLSTESRATPRAFMAVLRQLPQESFFPALWDSLPAAGEDGTLAGRMERTLVAGRVRAKTGTLTGSYQLAGYIPKQVGARVEYIPFVILTSTSARNREKVRRFQDALVVKMAEAIGRRELANR